VIERPGDDARPAPSASGAEGSSKDPSWATAGRPAQP